MESKIPKMAVYGVKGGNIKVFSKHWTTCNHKPLARSHL